MIWVHPRGILTGLIFFFFFDFETSGWPSCFACLNLLFPSKERIIIATWKSREEDGDKGCKVSGEKRVLYKWEQLSRVSFHFLSVKTWSCAGSWGQSHGDRKKSVPCLVLLSWTGQLFTGPWFEKGFRDLGRCC